MPRKPEGTRSFGSLALLGATIFCKRLGGVGSHTARSAGVGEDGDAFAGGSGCMAKAVA
jgi:hypothetical protein